MVRSIIGPMNLSIFRYSYLRVSSVVLIMDGTCKPIPAIPAPALTELAAAPVPGTAEAIAP